VNVTIITDLDSLIYFRKRETYQPATFIYENELGEKFTQAIKVKPRGKYRRRVCDFPTIKLDFKKKALKASGMAKYDKYKLVTHCVDDKKESRENVLREYLVYKMYNLLSPQSYRVQLINITYKDSKEKINTLERTAFLIEATKELEDRLDVDLKASLKLPIDSFDLEQYNFVALFQYMIGNVDWRATPFAKNIKIMKSPTTDAYELIPYDFDFSGVVGVSYMRLAEHLNQKNARQRIFLGHIINDQSELQKNFALFETKKEALLSLISNFELLCKPSRRSIRRYINSFYEDIADGMVATALLE
ncbi:MAG: hypothetical protein AAGJ18_11865, partial [Bacteroidota bacterium]